MLRQNPILPAVTEALGEPRGFSEDRRKVFFSVDDTVENVGNTLAEVCRKLTGNEKVDVAATFYVVPSENKTIVQMDN
ncbi:MAG: hypothetical protein IJN87_09775 [Firmicutes bacterium]|nr:hypothetical protein [Bacillota bacterium]